MSTLDILTNPPKVRYRELATEVNAQEFEKVVRSRRSVRVFTDEKIPNEIMHKCMELALLAPNSSNLQPWEFYRVLDAKKKKELAHICMGQSAANTASELIVCVARMDGWKKVASQMIQTFKQSGEEVPDSAYFYYEKVVPLAYTQGLFSLIGYLKKFLGFFVGLIKVIPRGPASYSDMRVWAHKSCALACENLMLSLRAYGYDSCPMEGLDEKRAKALLGIKGKAEICMVIGAGKRAENGVYAPQVRMPKENFYFEI